MPLLLILIGVLKLAERAALAAAGGYPTPAYPGAPYPRRADPRPPGVPQYPGRSRRASIVPATPHDFGKNSEGGQS